MMDLSRRGTDVRDYVRYLEEWLIRAFARFNIKGEQRPNRVGIWIDRCGGWEHKIAAIGVRIRRWVTLHGVAVNLDPPLEHFSGILPCGISGAGFGATSMHDLGVLVSMTELDMALQAVFGEVFGGDRRLALVSQGLPLATAGANLGAVKSRPKRLGIREVEWQHLASALGSVVDPGFSCRRPSSRWAC
jgi:lipoate-protein ligase B